MSTRIPRKQSLTEDRFVTEHLVPGAPVVVTDAMASWDLAWSPAVWTERFGGELVQVYNDLFDLVDVISLASYVERYMGAGAEARDASDRPYVRWYAQMKDDEFVWADPIFEAIAERWARPACVPRTGYLLPDSGARDVDPARDAFPAKGLFISGPGARTRLHCDPWASDAVLCQLFGEKRVTMFSPDLAPRLVRDGVVVDIEHPDPARFPGFAVTPTYEDTLAPGELLLIPAGWYHHVTTLTDSISVTWNFVHASTWGRFFRYLLTNPTKDADVLRYFAQR